MHLQRRQCRTSDQSYGDCHSFSILGLQELLFLGYLLGFLQLRLFLAGSRLLLQSLGLRLLCLSFVDCLDKHTLVLIAVTLGFNIEEVVDMLVYFLLLAVLAQEPAEHAQSANPNHLRWHPGLFGSAALASTLVAA